MRYIETTLPEDQEPTYNTFQKVAGSITVAAIVAVLAITVHSILSANIF